MNELTNTEKRFAEILKVDPNGKNPKGTIFRRLEYLGYTETCTRCGGTGHYSFNQMYGTICFKCHGAKTFTPSKLSKTTEKLIIADIEAGKLEPYFENCKTQQIANSAVNIIGKAWKDTGISQKYDWFKAAQHKENGEFPEDYRISQINKIMCDQYEHIQKLVNQYKKFGLEYSKEKEDFSKMLKLEVENGINIINEAAKQI